MKKKTLYILITVLIISQLISIIRINSLQRQVENTYLEMNNLSHNIRTEMNGIYNNVDVMLNQQASLIESGATEIGAPNIDQLTVPIIFTLIPKEVREHTAVSLDFNGELFPMEKDGTTFSATISRDIFSEAMPKIIIDENGIRKTTEDERVGIWDIKEEIFPTMYPRLMGDASYNGETYSRRGELSGEIKGPPSEIEYKEIRFVIKVDDQLISDEIIPKETFYSGYEVDEKISLSSGQVCTMTVIAIDSIGLEHHYLVDHWDVDSGSQRELWFNGDAQIYSSDGKLLWKPEYIRID